MQWLNKLRYGIIILFILISGIIYSCSAKHDNLVLLESASDGENEAAEDVLLEDGVPELEDISPGTVPEAKIFVHVAGSVCSPGVYELESDQRVFDAIEAAGGFNEHAAVDYLNLAGMLDDGMKLYIPAEDELESGTFEQPETQAQMSNDSVKVNINTAGREQLMTLPGIGESKADDIISYRGSHGSFSSIEDIMNVPGIKDGVFNKVKDTITID